MHDGNLESFVDKFEAAFAESSDVELRDYVPSLEHENYRNIATELIRVDIELRWNTEHRKNIEDYQKLFPDVVKDPACLDRIAFEEYRLRASSGEAVTPFDYQTKYSIRVYHWPVFASRQTATEQETEQQAKLFAGQPEFLDSASAGQTQADLAGRLVSGQLVSTPTVESSLHQRLRFIGIAFCLTLFYLSFLAWMNPVDKVGLFLGSRWLLWFNGICVLVNGLICGILWSQKRISLSLLRFYELILFGSVLSLLASGLVSDLFLDNELARPMREGEHELFHYSSSWSLPFFALMVAYGTVIPSSWLRCSIIVSTIGLIPIMICTVAVIGLHGMTVSFFQSFLVQMFIWMATGAAIAIYGVRRLEQSQFQLLKSGKLGKYQLNRRIGAGGMGEVFEAEHKLMNRLCAIKIMHPRWQIDPQLLARFEREVQALAGISHPNVVQIHDFGFTNEGIFYYVMELLDGRNLEQIISEEGHLPAKKVAKIILQVAGALSVIHRGGIVHRDIKPSNIFLERDPIHLQAKLLDFGLVKAVSNEIEHELTLDGAIIGTPAYMSPEQAAGDAADHRTDLYSLSAVAYFALTGRPVFVRTTIVETLTAHIASKPPDIDPSFDVPKEFKDILMRGLSKDPICRFQTADELVEAIHNLGFN